MLLNLWSIMFGLVSQSVYLMLPGRQPLEFHLCAGTNPDEGSLRPKINANILVVYVSSLIIHFVIVGKLKLYRSCSKERMSETQTLTDLTTSLAMIILMGVIVASLTVTADLDPVTLNFYPKYILIQLTQVFSPNMVTFGIMVVYYCRNGRMRQTLLRALKESL